MTGPGADEDVRRALRFMAVKIVVFAILPLLAAAAIVYLTLPR